MSSLKQKYLAKYWNQTAMFILMTLLLIILFFADILIGSVLIPVKQGFSALFFPSSVAETTRIIIFDFRLPKALTAVLTGVALSIKWLADADSIQEPPCRALRTWA
jgi:ABC-type Fe3+-siderophore transport system permease subunit